MHPPSLPPPPRFCISTTIFGHAQIFVAIEYRSRIVSSGNRDSKFVSSAEKVLPVGEQRGQDDSLQNNGISWRWHHENEKASRKKRSLGFIPRTIDTRICKNSRTKAFTNLPVKVDEDTFANKLYIWNNSMRIVLYHYGVMRCIIALQQTSLKIKRVMPI